MIGARNTGFGSLTCISLKSNRVIMGAGGSKLTPAEMLKENKNAIRTSLREIEREQRQIEKRRKEVESKVKKSAKEGRIVGSLVELLLNRMKLEFSQKILFVSERLSRSLSLRKQIFRAFRFSL